MTVPLRSFLALFALLFVVAHIWALPRTLEDIDSVNFALGVESFDVAAHRPHPPGYPVFELLAKASTAATGAIAPGWDRDRRAAVGLAVWSLLAGGLAVWVVTRFWIALGLAPPMACLAAVLGVTAPLFWINAVRPMSDIAGLVTAVAVQAALIEGWRRHQRGETAPRIWYAAALAAGFIIGIRSQTVWLTAPLLAGITLTLVVRGQARVAVHLVGAAAAGVFLWAVPLVWVSGGLEAYLAALGQQGAEDFAGVRMLATVPSWPLFQEALGLTFLAAWFGSDLARVVVGLAVIGLVWLALRRREWLGIVTLAYAPYLAFHLAFHETFTLRYGLPMLVPVAGLAVMALGALHARAALAGVTIIAGISLVLTQPLLGPYAEGGALSRAMRQMQAARVEAGAEPLLRMHHQVWWGIRRTLLWYQPVWDTRPQPFPGDRERMDVVRHWNSGANRPIWFLADPTRADLLVFDPRATRRVERFSADPGVRQLVRGERLDAVDWWTLDRPRWMAGRGWALSPEVAGVTRIDEEARPERGPVEAFLLRDPRPLRIMIGGRYLAESGSAMVSARLDGQELEPFEVSAEAPWFVRWIELPGGVPDGEGPYGLLRLTVRSGGSGGRPRVGFEQFDAALADEVMFSLAEGWWELEQDVQTGRLWRWSSDRSVLEIRDPGGDVRVTLAGESPRRHFSEPQTVSVMAGDRQVHSFTPSGDYREVFTVPEDALTASGGLLTIVPDRTFVPADRGTSPDRRTLGLRLEVVSVSR